MTEQRYDDSGGLVARGEADPAKYRAGALIACGLSTILAYMLWPMWWRDQSGKGYLIVTAPVVVYLAAKGAPWVVRMGRNAPLRGAVERLSAHPVVTRNVTIIAVGCLIALVLYLAAHEIADAMRCQAHISLCR
jgi:hypothetical protein